MEFLSEITNEKEDKNVEDKKNFTMSTSQLAESQAHNNLHLCKMNGEP